MLSLIIPLLMAGTPPPASPPPAAPPPSRRSFYAETGFGAATGSIPTEGGKSSFTGFGLRQQLAYLVPAGRTLRIGPAFAYAVSFASASSPSGGSVEVGLFQATLAPQFEIRLKSDWTASVAAGPTLAWGGRSSYLGPELSLILAQRLTPAESKARVGVMFHATAVPLFRLDDAAPGPGYALMFTFGLVAGVP